jgi:hypothetical protein
MADPAEPVTEQPVRQEESAAGTATSGDQKVPDGEVENQAGNDGEATVAKVI